MSALQYMSGNNQNKQSSKYISSSLQWNDEDHYSNRNSVSSRRSSGVAKGRISKGSSRMNSRAVTAANSQNGENDNDDCYSLPPMTARSLYIEPQFKKIDLPEMIRVNILNPPTIPKRTVTMQTIKATDHNKKRVLKMQRENHQMTHNAWKKYFYGNVNEKENYRASLRAALKQQMLDASEKEKSDRVDEINYSVVLD